MRARTCLAIALLSLRASAALGDAAASPPAPAPAVAPTPAPAAGATGAAPAPTPSASATPAPAAAASLLHSDAALDSAIDEVPAEQLAPIELPDLTQPGSQPTTLTLGESIGRAIRAATSVLKAENAVSISGSTLLQAYGQFLPNLTVQANYAYQNGTTYYTTGAPTTVTGSNTGAGYVVGTDLNLFNGLSDFAGLKSSLLRKESAELTLERARQAIALDITQSYLQIVLDNELVSFSRKNLEQSRAREDLLREQTRVGARNLADLYRQEAQASSDESLLLVAENRARTDQITFLQKLRADVSRHYKFLDPALPDEKPDERFGDEAALLRKGLVLRADLKASENNAYAAHWDIRTGFSGYLPKFDILASATSGGHYLYDQTVNGGSVVPATQAPVLSQLGSQLEYSVGLYLTWTVFDRLASNENLVKAQAAADNADIDAEDFRNQVEADVRQAYGNYQTSLQQLRASKKGLISAEKAYEVIEGRYEVGSATFIDLITAQATLLQAESTRAQALVDFILQGRSLEFATGEMRIP